MVAQQPGSFDTTFGTGGKLVAGGGSWMTQIGLQPDGKIVAVGHIEPAGINDKFVVMRINANGTMDTSFGNEGITYTLFGAKCGAEAMTIQSDGKIVVGGWTSNSTSNSGNLDYMIVRYNTNGSIDTSFGSSGIFHIPMTYTQTISSLLSLPDGKILAGGQADNALGSAGSLLRLTVQGVLDTTFNDAGVKMLQYKPTRMVMAEDGKIFITTSFRLSKYSTDGVLDTSFGVNGNQQTSSILGMPLFQKLANGDIMGAGSKTNPSTYAEFIVLHDANGMVKTDFANNGVWFDDNLDVNILSHPNAITSSMDRVYVGYSYGPASNYDYKVKSFTFQGAKSESFGTNGTVVFSMADNPQYHDYLKELAIQTDGKLIVAGNTVGSGFCFARLHTEQSLEREAVSKHGLSVYPNPATSYVNISLPENSTNAKFVLYDLLGKKVRDYSKAESVTTSGIATLSLEGIDLGVYVLNAQIEGTTTITKIIKK